jgi:hypothetical protein
MNKERLLKVARALRESREPKKFTMEKYGHSCGTPACALGHYASRRDLQHTFVLKTDEYGGCSVYNKSDHHAGYLSGEAEEHFGLDELQIHLLFGPGGCGGAKTTKQAARFIEKFVARGGK